MMSSTVWRMSPFGLAWVASFQSVSPGWTVTVRVATGAPGTSVAVVDEPSAITRMVTVSRAASSTATRPRRVSRRTVVCGAGTRCR